MKTILRRLFPKICAVGFLAIAITGCGDPPSPEIDASTAVESAADEVPLAEDGDRFEIVGIGHQPGIGTHYYEAWVIVSFDDDGESPDTNELKKNGVAILSSLEAKYADGTSFGAKFFTEDTRKAFGIYSVNQIEEQPKLIIYGSLDQVLPRRDSSVGEAWGLTTKQRKEIAFRRQLVSLTLLNKNISSTTGYAAEERTRDKIDAHLRELYSIPEEYDIFASSEEQDAQRWFTVYDFNHRGIHPIAGYESSFGKGEQHPKAILGEYPVPRDFPPFTAEEVESFIAQIDETFRRELTQ